MMTESQDVAVDLSGHAGDQNLDCEARPPATSEIHLGEDGDESVDELDMTKEERPSAPIWSFEYYQRFFDVDTDQVVYRFFSSFIPRHNFVRLIRPNPDLYGPFWVCITLALSFTICGNMTFYLQAASQDYQWTYNFRHLTFAATAIYSYVWLLPAVLWAWMWWRGMKVYSLFEITCVYGYSLSVFLPCSVIWIVPSTVLRWSVFMLGMVLSGIVLFRTFWPVLKKHDKKLAVITITIILALHAALSVGFVLYFYSSVTSHNSVVAKPVTAGLSVATAISPKLSTFPSSVSSPLLLKKGNHRSTSRNSSVRAKLPVSTSRPPGVGETGLRTSS